MTFRHVHSIAPLASTVISDSTEYERARAATSLGYELDALQRESNGSAADLMRIALEEAGTKRLEVALLDLIGFASDQQRLWQLWAQQVSTPCPPETSQADLIPDHVYLTMDDARVVRQNCAAVLAMVLTVMSSPASCQADLQSLPALQAMKEVPASVMASAKDMRQKISRSKSRQHGKLMQSPAPLDIVSERPTIPPTVGESEVPTRGDETNLNLLSSALMPIVESDAPKRTALMSARQQHLHRRTVSQYIADLEQHSTFASAASYLYDHDKSNARGGREGGYLRKVDGGYRAPNLRLIRNRPSILSLSDVKPEKDWRDEKVGYHVDKFFISKRLELRSAPPTYFQKREHPVTSAMVLKEHCDIASFASYAGTVALDPLHPHARRMRSIFFNVRRVSKNSMDLTSSRRMALGSAVDKLQYASGETAALHADVLESKATTTSEALKHFTTNKECTTTEASLSQARCITSREEGLLEMQTDTRRRTLRGPDALDVATPYLPVSPADVRHELAWSPKFGVREPLSLNASRKSAQNLVGPNTSRIATRHTTIRALADTLPDHLHEGRECAAYSYPTTDVVSRQEQHTRLINRCNSATIYKSNGTEDITSLNSRIKLSPGIRVLQKRATSAVKMAAREAKVAWRDARLQAVLKAPVHNCHDEPMTRIFSATDVARRAEEKLADCLQVETAEFIRRSVRALPMRLATQFAPHIYGLNFCSDDDSRLAYAHNIKRRTQRIIARWIDEYEKSQLVIALGVWRISVWECTRKDVSAEYRHTGAAARLRNVMHHHQLVVVARAFKTLASRTGWLIFWDRTNATVKIQTVYRRYTTQLQFITENDAHVCDCAYANVYLAASRDPTRVRFYINSRVRLKRRYLWKSAIIIQRQQRRHASHVDYQHARSAAILIESSCRMALKRRCFLVLRNGAIVVETVIRMFLISRPFERLSSASRLAQRVVRGFMGRRIFYDATYESRRAMARRASAPRVVQQFWRGVKARRYVAAVHNKIRQEQWAGLRLQFAWYRRKGSFATFVLLSCLRVSDEEDLEYAAYVHSCIRKIAARRISIHYRAHLTRMRHNMAIIIGSFWRRHVAINEKLKMRKTTWAKRKLQCFVRAKLKQRHESSRKIAHCWWRARRGRLLHHLAFKLAAVENAEEADSRSIRDSSAATIQAIIHGQVTRHLLRRERAILVTQCWWRIVIARLELARKHAEQKRAFVIGVASSSSKDAVNNELLAYRRRILNNLIRAQARVRGYMTREMLRLATVRAYSIAFAAMTLQRTVRQRRRFVAALKHSETTRRRKTSIFKDCKSFDDIVVLLSRCAHLPKDDKKPWLWYDVDDSFCGIGPHAVCRRSGLIEALPVVGGDIVSIRSLSAHKRSCGQSSSYKDNPMEDSLQQVSEVARQIILCRFTKDIRSIEAHRHAESKLDELKPLTEPCDRRTAALLVCGLRYAGVSHRQVNALPSHKDIEKLVSYQRLPFPCRKLVDAFSRDQILEERDAPRDLSLGMMRQFCARYADAEKALRALRSEEFTRVPWVPSPREVKCDIARVKNSYQIRRDALERLQLLLGTEDSSHQKLNRLSATITWAFRAADAAIDVASACMRRARRRRHHAKTTEVRAHHNREVCINLHAGASSILDSSSISPLGSSISHTTVDDKSAENTQMVKDGSTVSQRSSTSAVIKIGEDDKEASRISSYLYRLHLSHPDIYEIVREKDVLSVVPGIEQDERAVALAVANVVFCRALRTVSDYIRAAKRICVAAKRHVSRLIIATMRHKREVSKASIAYSRERSGEAVVSVWKASMKAHAESVEAEKAAWLLEKQRTQVRELLLRTLRFGWKCLEIPKAQVEASLRNRNEDELGREALLRVFERVRPRQPKPVHRNGVKTIPKYRDDDEAREPNVPRTIVKANQDPNDLRLEVGERERRRAPPLYDIEDYEASLKIQLLFRSLQAKKWLKRLQRIKRSQERDARERAEWERQQAERHRFVTVHCSVELNTSPILLSRSGEGVAAGESGDMAKRTSSWEDEEQGEFELALFESLRKIERGAHVLARYGGTGPERWLSSTIFDDARPDIYSVVFDDGKICKNVPRTSIKVPRISEASRVEARRGNNNACFMASVIQASSDGSFSVQYEDGTIENRVPRSQLRIPNIEGLMGIEEGRRQACARRRALQALQLDRERRIECEYANSQACFVSLCDRFSAARALFFLTGEIQQSSKILNPGVLLDQHASALARMARCVTEAQELTRPRYVVSLKIEYTRVALRYGWRELHDHTGRAYYAHTSRCTTWTRPAYDFADDSAARRIQRSMRLSLRRYKRDQSRGSSDLPTLVANVRNAASKFAWTPSGRDPHYADDRVPLELWMARRGFSTFSISSVLKSVRRQVGKVLDGSVQGRQSEAERTIARSKAVMKTKARTLRRLKQFSDVLAVDQSENADPSDCQFRSRSSIKNSTQTNLKSSTKCLTDRPYPVSTKDQRSLEALGLTQGADKNWLQSTSENMACFVAYWTSHTDTRSMRKVLEDAKNLYELELARYFRNQQTRCAHMAEALTKSQYPITFGQIRRFAHEFAGKPAGAQDAIKAKLVDVATTSTHSNELEALAILRRGAKRAKQLIEKMCLSTLAVRFEVALQTAEEVCPASVASVDALSLKHVETKMNTAEMQESTAHNAENMSSRAARACWMLDDEIFSIVCLVCVGTTLAQAEARRYLARKAHKSTIDSRDRAATTCQTRWRVVLALRIAKLYKAQQMADWHMLWDDNVKAFYFLQPATAEVSWEEPPGGEWSYRPQVRDRFTQRLMLAWPQLDRPKPLHLQQPITGKCMVCKVEDATRRCLSCSAPKFEGRLPSWGGGYFHFCFACFAAHHEFSVAMRNHEFEITKDTTAPALKCCVCSNLATRMCRGLFLQPRGRQILDHFFGQHRTADGSGEVEPQEDSEQIVHSVTAEKLRNVLWRAGIPLSLARTEELHVVSKRAADMADEAARCASYYKTLQETLRKLASECNDYFCASCWSSTHARGARAKHVWVGFAPGAPVCALCESSVATLSCEDCGDKLCKRCSVAAHSIGKNFKHKVDLLREPLDDSTESAGYCASCSFRKAEVACTRCGERFCDSCLKFEHYACRWKRRDERAVAIDFDREHPMKCAVCGRKPDSRCVECDEVFCTWLGKPRCFAKLHAKGRRREHTLVPFTVLADIDVQRQRQEQEELNRLKTIEELQAKSVEEFERAREEERLAKQRREDLIQAKATDVLDKWLLDERKARELKFTPAHLLLELSRAAFSCRVKPAWRRRT